MEMFNPPHPGEIIREDCLAPAGLSVTEAAVRLGVSRQSVSELINGRNGISADMALRLEKAGWGPALAWLRNQVSYDLWQARQAAKAKPRATKAHRLDANRARRNANRSGRNTMRQAQGFPPTALLRRKRAPPSAPRERPPPSEPPDKQKARMSPTPEDRREKKEELKKSWRKGGAPAETGEAARLCSSHLISSSARSTPRRSTCAG